jgi:MFS transporter, DHA1 family, inner membrane transport protein
MGLLTVSKSEADQFDRDSVKALTSAVILGTVGASTILVMPGLLGVIVTTLKLTEQQLGFVASVDIFTMAIVMGITALGIGRLSWRALGFIGLVILAAGNVASLFSTDYSDILWARALAGVGEGITVAISFAALGCTRNPDRAFGIYLVFGLLFAAIVLFMFPYFMQWGGYSLVFSFLIGLCVLNIAFMPWLTPQARLIHTLDSPVIPISPLVVGLGLLMVTFFFIAQGAVWSYLERIGFSQGLEPKVVGSALALSGLAGLAGAGIAMLAGNKCARAIPITAGVVVQVVSMVMLVGEVNVMTFIIAVMLFNFSWNLCQPYFSGIMSEVDPQGRVVVLMGSIQTIGVSVGPFIAAFIITPGNLNPISYLGIICVLLSLITALVLLNTWKKYQQGHASLVNVV